MPILNLVSYRCLKNRKIINQKELVGKQHLQRENSTVAKVKVFLICNTQNIQLKNFLDSPSFKTYKVNQVHGVPSPQNNQTGKMKNQTISWLGIKKGSSS